MLTPETADYFLEHGYFGTEAPGRPVRHFLDHLDRLEHARERARLGAWGLNLVRDQYGLGTAAERLEELYSETFAHTDSRWERLQDIAFAGGRDAAGRLRRELSSVWGTT